MKELESIRQLYRPIQPAVKIDNEQISYQEFYPAAEIRNYVHCYWELTSRKKLSRCYSYRVVSDGCIDIFFELENPAQNFIMGFCRKYTTFEIGTSFKYYGIRFLPAAFPALFQVNAKRLSNQSRELNKILPVFSQWLARQNFSQNQNINKVLDEKMRRIIKNRDTPMDPRFFHALVRIMKKKGLLEIEKDLNTGLSPRQMRRLFNHYIGTTPKAFANVVRFQHLLNAKPSKKIKFITMPDSSIRPTLSKVLKPFTASLPPKHFGDYVRFLQ